MLGLNPILGKNQQPGPALAQQPGGQQLRQMPLSAGASRFLQPVSQCEFTLTSILEQLQQDPWPVANDKRALRCTGTALSVGLGLLEVFT